MSVDLIDVNGVDKAIGQPVDRKGQVSLRESVAVNDPKLADLTPYWKISPYSEATSPLLVLVLKLISFFHVYS